MSTEFVTGTLVDDQQSVDPYVVTIQSGPSLGAGPLVTAIFETGEEWSAIPARGSRWKVVDKSTRHILGEVSTLKVRGEQRWKAYVVEHVASRKHQTITVHHKSIMYPVRRREDGSFSDDVATSRTDALRIALACLKRGSEEAGHYPVVIGAA
jgi:hypothetical protein